MGRNWPNEAKLGGAADLLRRLGDRFGADRVSTSALESCSIDGFTPRAVVTPKEAMEAAEILAFARAHDLTVSPLGGGTHRAYGNRPKSLDLILSTAGLDRIIAYEPDDFVITAQGGVTLGQLLAITSSTGQRLALDPPATGSSTLGGVLSANASGPHRYLYGTARDLVTGIEAALPWGSLVRSGGRVVKNVAGYDLKKLFLGAIGTLGVITEVSLKLHAIPEDEVLLAIAYEDFKSAGQSAAGLIRAGLGLTALEVVNRPALEAIKLTEFLPSATCALLLALEGDAETTGARAAEVRDDCARSGSVEARTLQGDATLETWNRLSLLGMDDTGESAQSEEDGETAPLSLHTSVPVRETAWMAQRLEEALSALGTVHLVARGGNGVIQSHLTVPVSDELVAAILRLRGEAVALGGSLVLHRASCALKERLDVWGLPEPPLSLFRRVKETFDPQATMSPGRFVGGL